MDADQRLLAIATLVAGSLYVAGVFVAGLVTGHVLAWNLALVTEGVCYFAYSRQLARAPRWLAAGLVCASAALGALAGIALLI